MSSVRACLLDQPQACHAEEPGIHQHDHRGLPCSEAQKTAEDNTLGDPDGSCSKEIQSRAYQRETDLARLLILHAPQSAYPNAQRAEN